MNIRPAWTPRVQGVGQKTKIVDGYLSRECPTSYITPESAWILDLADTNVLAVRDTGATLFGPDLRKYPAWWMDALTAIAGAKADYERAESEAMTK